MADKKTVVDHDLPAPVLVRSLFIIVAFLAAIWLVIKVMPIITLALVAVLLAVAINPAIVRLQNMGLSRPTAILSFMTVFAGLCIGGMFLLWPILIEQTQNFIENIPHVLERWQQNQTFKQLNNEYKFTESFEKRIQDAPEFLTAKITTFASNLITAIIAFFSLIFLTILFLLNGRSLLDSILKLWPELSGRRVWSVLHESYESIGGYVRGNLILSFVAGLTLVLCFMVLGLPYAIALGVWMAIFDLVPLVGATIGALPAIIVAFSAGGVFEGVFVTIFLFIYQQIENGFLQPHIMGKVISLSPLVIFLSVLFGAQIMGILGALLAIPVAGIIQILFAEYIREKNDELSADDQMIL